MTTAGHIVMKTTMKQVDLTSIIWEKRYRADLGDIEGLAASMQDKGVLQPITVSLHNPNGELMPKGQYWLLAGERRTTAAKKAGLEKIPAIIRESTDELDAREIELIENAFRLNPSWQEDCSLILELDRLYKTKQTDWSGRKTAALLNKGVASVSRALQLGKAMQAIPELGDMKTADDAFKTLKKLEEQAIVTELRKRQGSAMENKTFSRGLEDMLRIADGNYNITDTFKFMAELRSNGSVHFIECDPPYGIDLTNVKASKESVDSNVHSYEEVPANKYQAFLDKLTKELFRIAAKDAWMVFWFGPTWQHEVLTSLKGAGWEVDVIPAIWAKMQGQTMQPELYLGRAYEPFYICRKGKPVLVKRGRPNVFLFGGEKNKYHPTQRPVELIQTIIETFTVPTQVCFVPFLGSGATLRASYNLGLAAFGCDMNSEYKDKFMLHVEADTLKLLNTPDDEGDEESLIE